ncbi:TorD/DmsD family molecular chaperone [Archaeoglobus veneficus]|uniref:Anaerobic dehydrogenase-like protein n=1 Tax=Archaeoglobus veneficus (strain DSM 11195 / SNP6) TaxID=693661 RepID=F2KMX7_ARCVS|nr:molecular chaperone TorD family protein [Archaeoglobus veneficus]AEA47253.1 anaerobic dehydrogenase-like protein [Archaeoglobus veneficus SNP6]
MRNGESTVEKVMLVRKAMYSFLGNIFLSGPPVEFLRDVFDGEMLDFLPHPSIQEGVKILKEFASSFESFEEFEICVKREHSKVFDKCSPYQSDYDGNEIAELTVREILFDAGYEFNAEERADHIGIELLLMAETCSADSIESHRGFFEKELVGWVFEFCNALENNENTRFYRGIVKILRGFMEMEKIVINRL